MKISRLLLTFISMTVLSSMCQNALADNREGAIVLSPNIGAYLFDTNRGVKNNAMYDLGIGYDFNKNWGVQALAGTLPTSTKGACSQNTTANLYALDGIYHFSTNIPLEPYLLAGGGILDFSSSPKDSDTQANLNAGAGLEYFLGNSFSVHSDVRDIYTVANGKSDVLFNFGVSLLLGGHCAAAPAFQTTQADPCMGSKVVVRFTNKQSVVDTLYKTELQQIVTCMQDNPRLTINLDGYADSMHGAKDNLRLAQQRADAVKQYLVEQGVDPVRIHAQGFGETGFAANTVASSTHQSTTSESVIVSMFGRKG